MRLIRYGNPVVRAVLRSRAHRVLSRRLLLLSYRGRRSGRRYEIPLRYTQLADGRLVVLALRPERKLWWRSVRAAPFVSVVLRGTRLAASAVVVEGPARDEALAEYAGGSPRIARVTRDAAVVVFTPTR